MARLAGKQPPAGQVGQQHRQHYPQREFQTVFRKVAHRRRAVAQRQDSFQCVPQAAADEQRRQRCTQRWMRCERPPPCRCTLAAPFLPSRYSQKQPATDPAVAMKT